MKLLNWNVNFLNRTPFEAVDFALESDSDVITLQEVTNSMLSYIEYKAVDSDYEVRSEVDSYSGKDGLDCHLVTITKHDVHSSGSYEYYDKEMVSLFKKMITPITRPNEQHKSLYVDIKTGEKVHRVHNIHLTWPVGPNTRLTQFNNFFNNSEFSESSIICGDFNVIGVFPWNYLFAPIFGTKIEEIKINERAAFDNLFEELGLQNPFTGTCSWSAVPNRCQLDHVLVDKQVKVLSKELVKRRYGSDHYPQVIEVEF